MPNLAGMFFMGSHPIEVAPVPDRLARVLDVHGVDYTVREWRDERFAAVNLLNGICGNLDQPATAGDRILFLDGEVSNLREGWIASEIGNSSPSCSTPAHICLQLYERHGDDFVTRLNGQFNVLVYDRADRSVKVFNDRLGYRPFYYWCNDGLALFGLEKKAIFALLGRTPSFDPLGVLEFVTFGHNLDDRTLFAGVQAMPQGVVLEFKDCRATVRRYWRPAYEKRNLVGSLEEGARELGSRLCRAVMRRADGARRYGISLSGGLDSRAVAGALAMIRGDVASFTFGPDDSPDLRYGRQLAERAGFSFHRVSYDNISRAGLLPQVVWRTEGAIPFSETFSIAQHRQIRPEADVIFNGHFGGVVSGALILPEQFLVRDARQLTAHILAKRTMLRVPTLRVLFKRSFFNDTYREVVSGIEHSLRDLGEERHPLACNLWNMTVRARRFTFCSPAVDRYLVEQVTPFTDNDVVDWMLRMPLRYLFGQRVYKRMIVETFPELASVPWAKTGQRLSRNFSLGMTKEARLFAAKRLRRLATCGRDVGRDTRVGDLRSYVDTRLKLDAFPADLFDRDGVRRSIYSALDARGSATVLFVLLTLAECALLFGTEGPTEPPPETQPDL